MNKNESLRSPLRYQRVYRELRARVLSGQYEPGAQIETEPELCKQFDVSIITIRQAEGMLEEDGFIDRQQGRGTFVPKSVRGRLKVMCVVGLDLSMGLHGSYHSDLILLSRRETARLDMEFEAVWLDRRETERIKPYLDEAALREYWGFVFVACHIDHPLLVRARKLGMRYVVISPHAPEEPRRVWLDIDEAIRLGLRAFDTPPLIIGLANLQTKVEKILKETGVTAPQVYLPYPAEGGGFEVTGYLRTLELHREGVDLSRILILDDIVAQGVTRAMLKLGVDQRKLKLAVICGRQEVIPLGLPVMYVMHDTDEEVRQAFAILQNHPPSRTDAPTAWRSGFRIVIEAE